MSAYEKSETKTLSGDDKSLLWSYRSIFMSMPGRRFNIYDPKATETFLTWAKSDYSERVIREAIQWVDLALGERTAPLPTVVWYYRNVIQSYLTYQKGKSHAKSTARKSGFKPEEFVEVDTGWDWGI